MPPGAGPSVVGAGRVTLGRDGSVIYGMIFLE